MRRMVQCVAVLGLGLFLWTFARPAQAGPLVRLDIHDCDTFDPDEARRILEAELGADLVTWHSAGVTTIDLVCSGTTVQVNVNDPVTRKTVARRLNLSSAPDGSRARLVALATAELVVASWSELELIGAPSLEPVQPAPPREAISAAHRVVRERQLDQAPSGAPLRDVSDIPRGRRPRYTTRRLLPVVSARGFVNHEGLLWGGGARYGEERNRVFSWAFDGLVESGTIQDGGANQYEVVTSTVGGLVAFSRVWRYLAVRGGVGLRLGMSRTARVDTEGESHSTVAPWGWPLLSASTDLHMGPHWLLELGGEAGYVVLPVSGGITESASALQGTWLSFQTGLGWRW